MWPSCQPEPAAAHARSGVRWVCGGRVTKNWRRRLLSEPSFSTVPGGLGRKAIATEQLHENQKAAHQQRRHIHGDDHPIHAKRIVEHAVARRLNDRNTVSSIPTTTQSQTNAIAPLNFARRASNARSART